MSFFKIKKETIIYLASTIVSLSVLWGAWELMAIFDFKIIRVIPPPTAFIGDLINSDFKIGLGSQAVGIPQSILASVSRVFIGLFVAFSLAVLTGILLSLSVWVKRFVMPIVELLAPIAPIAWIPLAITLFGIGNGTAIFIVFMGVYFILTIATVHLVSTVPHNLLKNAEMLGCSRYQKWRYVVFPYILPSVFTILRINFIAAWMAVLAAEMTGLHDGLGYIISTGRNLFNSNLMLLGMALIGLTGFVVDATLRYIQNKYLWWENL